MSNTSATPNKVQYNLHNCYYALPTQSGWGTPVAIPGAVSISLEPKGEAVVFYADGIEYKKFENNQGYDGELTLALVSDALRQAILGETLDTNNVLFEKVLTSSQKFAFGFQIDGDEKDNKFWYYNCTCTRPKVESKTTEESIEVNTDTLALQIRPTDTGAVRAKTTADCTGTIYSGWFNQVVTEGMTPPT